MNIPFVLPLTTQASYSSEMMGGKAANLARLLQMGVPVPHGFCITLSAYRRFVSANGLDTIIADTLGNLISLDHFSVTEASKAIRHAFSISSIPLEMESDILTAFSFQVDGAVAVRSSANAEDLPSASFAGQHESFLDVTSPIQLLESVKKCWSSLWTPRAISYRASNRINDATVAMAVVVHRLVQPTVSGILFTRNPLTGADEIVINAGLGLGEGLVSGTVPPEVIIINKKDGRIREQKLGPNKTTCLTGDGLQKLVAHANRIEGGFGQPMDIEWVALRNEITIVQARPITAANQAEVGKSFPAGMRQKIMSLLLEYFPTPLYPFDRSSSISLLRCSFETLEKIGLKLPNPEAVLTVDSFGVVRPAMSLPRLDWRTPLQFLRFIFHLIREFRSHPSQFYLQFVPVLTRDLESMPFVPDRLSDEALEQTFARSIKLRDRVFITRRPYFWSGFFCIVCLQSILRLFYQDRWSIIYFSLTKSLDLPTTRINRDLHSLQSLITRTPRLRELFKQSPSLDIITSYSGETGVSQFVKDFDSFLQSHGSRTPDLVPLPSRPSWADDPSNVLLLLQSSLPSNTAETSRINSEQASDFDFSTLAYPLRGIVRWLAKRSREMTVERDHVIRAYEQTTVPIRRVMQELGRRLNARGMLQKPADVKFLQADEAFAHLRKNGATPPDLNSVIRCRKMARPLTLANWERPRRTVFRRPGSLVILRGLAASSGVHTGKVVILRHEKDFVRLEENDILVCVASNPSWTPLFGKAGAVVTDLGGSLSHAAIVAREFSIPAVLNTETATTLLQEGHTYTVDGTKGLVLVSKAQ